ncbi:MAG: type IV pili twitching motility protein PilT, partial [Oscillospiraceae bacterium]|nr:type IV pili twitching motility protein PilT [Oscillospiraceae bacterium]
MAGAFMANLSYYLEKAVSDGASDLFIVAGGPVSEKLDGRLKQISEERLLPGDTKALISEIYEAA